MSNISPHRLMNNNRGMIFPLTILFIGVITLLGASIWLLHYYSSAVSTQTNEDIAAQFALESALSRIKYKVNTANFPGELTLTETFPTNSYSLPLKYTALISPKKNGLPFERVASIDIYVLENKNPRLIKTALLEGSFLTSLAPYQFQYAISAGRLSPEDKELYKLNIHSGRQIVHPFQNIPLDQPNWDAYEHYYSTVLEGDQYLQDIDFTRLGPLVKVSGDLYLEHEVTPVTGVGTLVVTGKTYINGDVLTTATCRSNSLALISRGAILIQASAHRVQAMLYTAGNLSWADAHTYQLTGCAIAEGTMSFAQDSTVDVWYDDRFTAPTSLYNENSAGLNLFLPIPFIYTMKK